MAPLMKLALTVPQMDPELDSRVAYTAIVALVLNLASNGRRYEIRKQGNFLPKPQRAPARPRHLHAAAESLKQQEGSRSNSEQHPQQPSQTDDSDAALKLHGARPSVTPRPDSAAVYTASVLKKSIPRRSCERRVLRRRRRLNVYCIIK